MPKLAAKAMLLGIPLVILLLAPQAPSVRAGTSGTQVAEVTGPHSIWWASSVWNNRVPGDVIRYLFLVYNDDPANVNMTLKSLQLQTPWGNFTASGLPRSICASCRYAWAQYMTIPPTQPSSNVTFYTRLTGNYGSGTALCADAGNVCEDITPVLIGTNSTSLQHSITTYSSLWVPLGVAIPSIVAVVLLVLYLRKSSP